MEMMRLIIISNMEPQVENMILELKRKQFIIVPFFNQHIINLLFNTRTLSFYKDWNKVVGDFSCKLLDYLDAESLKDLKSHDLNPE